MPGPETGSGSRTTTASLRQQAAPRNQEVKMGASGGQLHQASAAQRKRPQTDQLRESLISCETRRLDAGRVTAYSIGVSDDTYPSPPIPVIDRRDRRQYESVDRGCRSASDAAASSSGILRQNAAKFRCIHGRLPCGNLIAHGSEHASPKQQPFIRQPIRPTRYRQTPPG